jgi:tight adherence protein B
MSEWIALAALLFLIGGLCAGTAHVYAVRMADRARVSSRFRGMQEMPASSGRTISPSRSRLLRTVRERMWEAGIAPQIWHAGAAAGALAVVTVLGALRGGLIGAIGLDLALVGSAVGLLSLRAARRRARIVEQLPAFIEHLVRAVQTGASIQNAIVNATAQTREPLRGVFERVSRQVQLGVPLEAALDQPGVLMDLRELRIFALTLHVNQRFGGSIRDLLRSVVGTVRTRERARREFKAMTGETRLSAWILGLLPVAIGLYILTVNPAYLQRMADDPTGSRLLLGAFALQGLGSLVIWRMVRSV